ncbi:361467dd-8020-4fcf-a965-d01972379fb8 [Thermothielavioides terrestris]|uniref:Co-chaperone HscB C-terminal oligomerisation domain-containing protein n=2 Tax=Thermothielavioides terrestris TaxID=2587410 RepID=G2QZG9_THETT|nr:uncharacterized protein THITE_2112553 [Thermothielavioides terrestris NRRL 8126]AEO65495.1 hypothetical protein THITE_2112553 [Thermothielavioides terrestris NRRL 8126]SPQ19255.1 361467dd-8020-4fcf-a965-d01972379fb8 [Thermothielavioides terrestris]
MRASLISGSARAAADLCAACRREAVTALTARSAAAGAAATWPSRRTLRTAASSHIQSTAAAAAAARRWGSTASQSRDSVSTDSASAAPASGESPSPSSSIPLYYALFPETLPHGPPPAGKFDIDLRALRREFLRLQAASHPDFHHHAAEEAAAAAAEAAPGDDSSSSSAQHSNANNNKSAARLRAEAHSALLNTAYRTLCSPLLRAQYLLQTRHGVDLAGDETGSASASASAGAGGASERNDAALLAEVLEAREAIEEAECEADLEEVRAANERRVRECEQKLGAALEADDVPAAVEQAVRLRYWVNIREGIDEWERGKPVVLQH